MGHIPSPGTVAPRLSGGLSIYRSLLCAGGSSDIKPQRKLMLHEEIFANGAAGRQVGWLAACEL